MGTEGTMKRYAKPYEELTLADDFMFCKIMQTNPDLCKELVELIIDRRIREIVSQDTQKPIEITADAKGVRFDVYLEDDEHHVYDIEMQTTVKKELPKRMRYYQGMIDLNMIERGAKYTELKKSYIIFICLENPFVEAGLHKYTFQTVCMEKKDLVLEDETVKILLSALGDANDVSEEMKEFLHYLVTQETNSDFTRRLEYEVETAREHRKWRGEYMTLQEKFDEIREESWEEGRNAERREIAADMLRAGGVSVAYIAKISKLSEEDVWKLADALDVKIPEADSES